MTLSEFSGLTAGQQAQFRAEGYVVFERAIPEPLLRRLRSVAEVARTLYSPVKNLFVLPQQRGAFGAFILALCLWRLSESR